MVALMESGRTFEEQLEALQHNFGATSDDVEKTQRKATRAQLLIRMSQQEAVECWSKIQELENKLRAIGHEPKTIFGTELGADRKELGGDAAIEWVRALVAGDFAAEMARFELEKGERVKCSLWM